MAKKSGNKYLSLNDHRDALAEALDSLPQVVVFEGPEQYLRRSAMEKLVARIKKRHSSLETISLYGGNGPGDNSTTLGDVLQELNSSSLFASEKAVVIHSADRLLFPVKSGDDSEDGTKKKTSKDRSAESFVEYVKFPTQLTWLIIECEKLPKNRVIGKALAANSLVVPCPILSRSGDVATWLQMAAKETGKRLEAGVSDILFTAHGGQLGKLHGELQKLSIYVGQKETIQSEDVEAFLSGSVEFDVFGLTNSIEARDLGGALGFAKRICMQGTRDADGKKSDGQASAHRTLSMLASTIEGILGARVAMGQGASREDVASAVGTTPWRAERLMAAAGRYSIADLRRIVRTLAEEMRSTHDTGGDISFSLEKCVIACCHRQ